jgi:hypothetical protein
MIKKAVGLGGQTRASVAIQVRYAQWPKLEPQSENPTEKTYTPPEKKRVGKVSYLYHTPEHGNIQMVASARWELSEWPSRRNAPSSLFYLARQIGCEEAGECKSERITSYTHTHTLARTVCCLSWVFLRDLILRKVIGRSLSRSGTRFLHKPFLQPNMKSIDFLPLNAPL